jgi:hypothetical protein
MRTSDTEFELVSKGVITRALFTNAVEQADPVDVKLLLDNSTEAVQQNYTAVH